MLFSGLLNRAHRTNDSIENGSVERNLNLEQSEMTDDNRGKISHVFYFFSETL